MRECLEGLGLGRPSHLNYIFFKNKKSKLTLQIRQSARGGE